MEGPENEVSPRGKVGAFFLANKYGIENLPEKYQLDNFFSHKRQFLSFYDQTKGVIWGHNRRLDRYWPKVLISLRKNNSLLPLNQIKSNQINLFAKTNIQWLEVVRLA